jgi:hypothetical protein
MNRKSQREVLVVLGRVWEKFPNQRLTQLLVNVTQEPDPFYVSDDRLVQDLRAYESAYAQKED